jgi:hypothetical protein
MAKTRTPRAARTVEQRARELLKLAQKESAEAESWIDLHNAIYGIGGHLGKLFPAAADRLALSKMPEFQEIARLISDARDSHGPPASGKFVLRLPESLHAALIAEARREGVSLNQLCLAKLCAELRSIVVS